MTARPATMTVYVMVPHNDRPKGGRVTVRTTTCPLDGHTSMIPADLSLKAARQIARWYEEHKDQREDDLACSGMPTGHLL